MRPPSPPSSTPASASNPTGTPPSTCNASGPWAAGAAGDDGPASPAGWPGSPTWGGCAMTDRQAAQRRPPGRSSRYISQPNNAIETGRATSATRGATASTLTTSGSWINLLAASVPIPVPAWPGPAVAGVRAGRASASPPLRGCRLGTLRPAGPADLLAGRQIAARPLQGQGRSVPPCGPVLPSPWDALRAPLTPPQPARSGDSVRPRWARSSRPASSKGR
jgi:hypothetical protein